MQESVILVRWLAGVCWRESIRDPSRHNRLRAAVFVGLNELRKAFSRAGPILSAETLPGQPYDLIKLDRRSFAYMTLKI